MTSTQRLAIVGAFAAVLATSTRAHAVETEAVLVAHTHSGVSPQNFAIEIRGGVYRPEIDQDPGLQATGVKPYQTFFNNEFQPLVGLEFDWQAVRIPYLGTLGPGFGIEYSQMQGQVIPTRNTPVSEKTTLQVMPTQLLLVLRADVLMREAKIPFVPYVKGGLGLAPWRASNEEGTSSGYDPNRGVYLSGEGTTIGYHLAGGIAFQLDVLDAQTARNFDTGFGVNHSYIFAEYMRMGLTGLAQSTSMRLSDTTWATGLAFEF
jgi:hypothetical protein